MTYFFAERPAGASPVSGLNRILGPRVGLTAGRVLGKAVERNRIKRRMREAVRLSAQACEGPIDVVFNPRKSVGKLPFAELVSEVNRALRLAAQRARTGEQKWSRR
jgi:ribonuclease P protein component